jgi:hypothetical protein
LHRRALIRPVGHLLPFASLTGEGHQFIAFSRALAWEKVPKGDEGLLITRSSLVLFAYVTLQPLLKRSRVKFKQVIVFIVEVY